MGGNYYTITLQLKLDIPQEPQLITKNKGLINFTFLIS